MLGPLGARRHIGEGLGFNPAPAAATPFLEAFVTAITDAGGVVPCLFDGREGLTSGPFAWVNQTTTVSAGDMVEISGTRTPTIGTSGGYPAVVFERRVPANTSTGAKTAAFDASTYTSAAIFCVLSDADVTPLAIPAAFGWGSDAGTFLLYRNVGGDFATKYVSDDALTSQEARASAPFSVASPTLGTTTVDISLLYPQTTIRRNGVDITTSNAGSTVTGNLASNLFFQVGNPQIVSGAQGWDGSIIFVAVAMWTGTLSLAAVAAADALVVAEYSL